MSHFSRKSLTFYGVAIGTVVVLFNVVSAWGENNLEAPPPVNGLYRLETNNLPACLKSEALVLILQQSGIFLRGQLLPQSDEKSLEILAEEAPFISGRWSNSNQEMNLSGSVSQFKECQNETVNLQASFSLQAQTLTGQLNFNNSNEVVNFTSQKEEVKKKATGGH